MPLLVIHIKGDYYNIKICYLIIILLTYYNIIALVEAVELFLGLRVGVLKLVYWIREALNNSRQ